MKSIGPKILPYGTHTACLLYQSIPHLCPDYQLRLVCDNIKVLIWNDEMTASFMFDNNILYLHAHYNYFCSVSSDV